MTTPSSYPHRILLAVTGLSPQIVTETLYALTTGKERFIPTEVHLITTNEGAERARLALLSEEPGWFHRLLADYELPPIAFTANHIHVLHNAEGETLADIRTPQDNLLCADAITELVRQFTEDGDCALHVSIAGGRKTMGFFLGYALSLFGRPQDRLSHVLVSEPFESSWNFFYPAPAPRVIETRDRRLADSHEAQVMLADIPFVRLRHGLPSDLLAGSATYHGAVNAAQVGVGPARLEISLVNREVRAGGRAFTLPPAELALYALFARRAMACEPALPAPPKSAPDMDWADRYLRELRQISGPQADLSKTEGALRCGMEGEYFSQALSKLHRSLKRGLGTSAAPYLIHDGGHRPRRYRLSLPADAVSIRSTVSGC